MRNSYLQLLGCGAMVLCGFANNLQAQAGLPDPGFGNAGTVITDVGAFNVGLSMAIQPDGKIVLGGYADVTGNEGFAVTRYNINGSLDTAFGNGGTATVDFGSWSDEANKVLLQPDGKIILAGYAHSGSGNSDFAAARFLADGSIDTTFGVMGKVTTDLTGNVDYGYGAALQADGKIMVAGPAAGGIGGDVGLIRYTTDGTLDSTFSMDGIMLADIGGGYDAAFCIVIQPDGKFVTGGYSWNGTNYDFALARFDTSGSFDNTFGINGKVMTQVGPTEDILNSMTLQSDGKIVAVGYMWDSAMTTTDYAVVRYLVNGTPDPSFGMNGKATGSLSVTYEYLRSVAIQPDGKIVATGHVATAPGDADLALIRLNSNGTPDSTFNGTGVVIDDVNGEFDYAQTVAIQSDRKIVIAGGTLVPSVSDVDQVVVRYFGDEELGVTDVALSVSSLLVYPNPVSSTSILSYTLTSAQEVSVYLYDAQGKLVYMLLENEMQNEGEHAQALFIPAELEHGIYFVEVTTRMERKSVEVVK